MNPRPPLPPFTEETAQQKVQMAEDAWNSRDPERVSLAYTPDTEWRNRDVFLNGQPQATMITKHQVWRADLYELLNAYCAERAKSMRKRAYRTFVRRAYPLATARQRLEQQLTKLQEWSALAAFTPPQ